MSTNPALGHLYHDQSISSALTALNFQEKMKTRTINAREMKHLDKYTRSIDRAKGVCKRRNEWEQKNLRHQLKTIEWKTPSLARSLRTESERQKNLRPSFSAAKLVLPKLHHCDNIVTTDESNDKVGRHPVYVSSWSVYSNGRAQVRSAPELYRKDSVNELDSRSFHPRYSPDGDDARTRTASFMKKTEQVTKTLHRLYTQSLERKVKEQQTTVLDVLGKESKEELEKALFVLRGTPAGDLIEEILRDKEFVTKQQNDSNNGDLGIESGSVDHIEVNEVIEASNNDDGILKFQSNCRVDEGMDTNNYDLDNMKTEMIDYSVLQHGSAISLASVPASKLLRERQSRTKSKNASDVNDMFERDESWFMSSTIANASDTGAIPHGLRWTDIFKTPELWKQNKRRNKYDPFHKKDVSLVTSTGKRRQTMLKKR